MTWGIIMAVAGYLCGSLASAIIVCRVMKLPDPRAGGSGNPGATNVLRTAGKQAAALTLAGDVLKGLVPVAIAQWVSPYPEVPAVTAVAAVLGHLYPVFFQFKGGKGVATSFGASIGLVWPVAAFMAVIWALVAATTRYASLASLCAAIAGPVFALLFVPVWQFIVALSIIAALLAWRHRANILRLKAGTESEIEL